MTRTLQTARVRRKDALRAVMLLALLALGILAAPAGAAPFGVEPGSFATVLSGALAGEHSDLSATFTLSQEPEDTPTGYVRNMRLALPPGLIANPGATPRCAMGTVLNEVCSAEAAVGIAEIVTALPPAFESVRKSTVFVYNVEPYPDEPAAFAFLSAGTPVRLDASLPRAGGYGLAMSATDLSDARPLISAKITLWGVPADHNGPLCHLNEEGEEECVKFGGPGKGARLPFLSNPVQCAGAPSPSTLGMDSWQSESFAVELPGGIGVMSQCEGLRFEPTVATSPLNPQVNEPTGYEVAVRMPSDQTPDGRAVAELRSARISLPPGTVVSPSAGVGLQGCSDALFEAPPAGEGPAECPSASQIGSATITTPVLSAPMTGELFLGSPQCGPCTALDAQEGRMLRVFVQAAGSGVLVKLVGSIRVDQATGRLTLIIDESPQLPLEELRLTLNDGPRALLANPADCSGPLQGTAQLTPYSSDLATEVDGSSFLPTGCVGPRFAPSFSAGTVANQAARSSATVVSISRADQDQRLERFAVKLAPGLLGLLSQVPVCTQQAAQAAACPTPSQIGSVTVASGPGPEPLALAGEVFLTGPYEGAPFGLSIVVPAKAGPIDLGTIDIRAGVEVDPRTAALTILSGAVPQALAGVPLQIKSLNLDIDRTGFMVNPTDCRALAIGASIASAQGTSAVASQHFQAAGCAKLAFRPALGAIANARASRLGGADVHIKLASRSGQANTEKIKLDLPKALPSRLTTLQGACLEATFKADPARCPSSSVVGTGAITTPFLRAVLRGPVYMVSHGGRAYPDLDAVLQGEGVTLMLVGTTGFANGISSEAFRSLPDAPISTLDLMFPAGPHSAFAANANLCRSRLNMPTQMTGQNGAVVKRTTRIGVAGCPSTGRAKHAAALHRVHAKVRVRRRA